MPLFKARSLVHLAALGLLGAVAATSIAHDEDWRKLADKLPAFNGPIVQGKDAQLLMDQRASFTSSNVTLQAWIPLNNFQGNPASGNDCWGYVSPSGREYAIMGVSNGYNFVEVTNPTSPVIVGFIAGPESLWHDIKIIGDRAYGVSEAGSGIQVIDLSDIDNGNVVHVTDKVQAGHSTTHNIVANPDSGFLYLSGGNISNGGLVAVSTTNPDNPTIVGAWSDMYVHDAQVVSYTSGPMAGKEIAYCASGFNGGFSSPGIRVVDVTNKNNMQTIATVQWPNAGYSHQCWLSEDRQLLYVNDELDEMNGLVSTTTTHVIDVSNPANPSLLGTFTTGLPSIDHNLYTKGNFIYEANYRSGLRVFDATDPINPTEIAFFDTFPGSDSPNFNGAWSVYPYLPSGTIIVSDLERGLFILDVTNDTTQRLDLQFVGSIPPNIDPAAPTPITIQITETNVTLDPASVLMTVTTNNGTPADILMTSIGSNQFTADLPPSNCFDELSFFVAAQTTLGNQFTSSTENTAVITGFNNILVDNFETNAGWSVQDIAISGGSWQRGTPNGLGDRGDPTSDADGSGNCWITENGPGNTDVDGGPTRLLSPTFDLAGQSRVVVSFAAWFTNDDGDGDRLDVHVSNNNGASWTQAMSIAGSNWSQQQFLLDDFVTLNSQIRVRFSATDNPNDSVTEAGIDDFRLTAQLCTAPPNCPADLNGDGVLDVLDFFAFIVFFNAGDPAADLDNNGSIDVLDFFTFITLFSAGCP